MLIECPKCGFQGKIDATKIPEQGARLTCRQCQEKFSVSPPTAPQGTVPAPELPGQQPSLTTPTRPTAAAQPATASPPEESRQWTCSLCGENFTRHELVRFGEKLVCGNCKPAYVQMLQEGVAHSLDMRYAGFWVRFAAKFIDGILIWILFIPFSPSFFSRGSPSTRSIRPRFPLPCPD